MSVSINGTNGLVFSDGTSQNTSPFTGGFGFRNRIINGDMRIDQRNAGASGTAANAYTVDRWQYYGNQVSKFTWQQKAGAVTPPVGFTSYLGFTSSSAYSVLANDIFQVAQYVEGFNCADLAWGTANAKSVTLSFLIYSSLTGTFGGCLQNNGPTRSYPFTYTVSAANTWTPISITIAGDTTGTWLTNNGQGVTVLFSLGMGSNRNGTAGAWAAGDYRSVSGAVSVVGTSGATFYITGVQLEKGSTATSFDYRPFGTELALCQRYCRPLSKSSCPGQVYASTGAALFSNGVPMRATPTLSTTSGFKVLDANGNEIVVTSIAIANLSADGTVQVNPAVASGLTAGNATFISTAPANAVLSSEL